MRIKSVLYIALLALSTMTLLLPPSIILFAIMPIMITAASILTALFGYPWIIGVALRFAASGGSVAFTKIFIALGADVNAADNQGSTPLHISTRNGHTATVVALTNAGANVNATDQYGDTPLHISTMNGHISTALAIRHPLHGASRFVFTEIADVLIDNGADVNAKNKFADTPLHNAAANGHAEITLALIKKGAYVNVADNCGRTPLFMPVALRHTVIAIVLIAGGADVNDTSMHVGTPLQIATNRGYHTIAQALTYPLHWAARLCDIKTVKELIDIGYDVQAKLDDKTPLEHAIAADNLNVAKYLLALTKPMFADLCMPEADNNTTTFLKLAASEPDDRALTVGSSAIQNQLATRIQNSKIYFAKALFGIPTTYKAIAMVKFMMFNLTFKIKGSYRDAIVIANYLVKRGTTDKGKTRPSLCPDVIGIILNFAGLMPEKTSIDAIAHPYYKALNSRQITSSEMEAKDSTLPNTIITNSGPGSPAAGAQNNNH